jgi:hypothetical protein
VDPDPDPGGQNYPKEIKIFKEISFFEVMDVFF